MKAKPTFLITLMFLTALNLYAQQTKKIAITFDADMTVDMKKRMSGGEVFYDPEVVKIIQKEKISCTIFLTGLWAINYSDVVQAIAGDSLFEFGNHTFSHPFFTKELDQTRKIAEILDNKKILEVLTGQKIKLFRFPGGVNSVKDSLLAENLNQRVIRWNLPSGDAFENDKQKIFKNVTSQIKDGDIIVFHLGGPKNAPKTAKALKLIIPWLKKQGYQFVKVSQLLNAS